MRRVLREARPTRRSQGIARFRASRIPLPPSSSLIYAFSTAETLGIRWKLWKMNPTSRSR